MKRQSRKVPAKKSRKKGGIASTRRAKPIDIEADRAAIRKASDVEWLKAAQAKDVERVISFYSDRASVLPPNAPAATDREAIRAIWARMVGAPGFAINWHTTTVEVSRAGDLGYQLADYEVSLNNPEGKPISDRGKYVAVWKKQSDGSWKVVADIWNSDQPLLSRS